MRKVVDAADGVWASYVKMGKFLTIITYIRTQICIVQLISQVHITKPNYLLKLK